MGKASKALIAFIEDIPDLKLSGFSEAAGTIHSDDNFRLDMQGMTSEDSPRHNLQIQVNRQTSISTLKKLAPKTVAGPVLAVGDEAPQTIRDAFLESMDI